MVKLFSMCVTKCEITFGWFLFCVNRMLDRAVDRAGARAVLDRSGARNPAKNPAGLRKDGQRNEGTAGRSDA